MRNNPRIAAALLAATMAISMIPPAAAADTATGHWAQKYLETWKGYGVMTGDETGDLMPDKSTTRAELAVMMDAIMDYQVKGKNNYLDVVGGSWYADAILSASAAGLLSGYPGSLMKPGQAITRQEAVVMMANVLELDTEHAPAANYQDSGEIASWARGAVNAMTAKGYIGGFEGKFRPQAPITRAEIAVIFTNIFSSYIHQAGTYTDDVDGNLVVSADGVTLEGQTISGDLIIAEGVGDGHIVLDSVTVEGKLIVRGGGENSIVIKGNSKVGTVSVSRQGGEVRLSVEDTAKVDVITIHDGSQDVKVEGTVNQLTVAASDIVVTVTGNVGDIDVTDTAEDSTVYLTNSARVDTITVSGDHAIIDTQKGAKVDDVILSASDATVSGDGTVSKVEATEDATGATVTTPGTKVENNSSDSVSTDKGSIGSGETATTPGGSTSSGGSSSSSHSHSYGDVWTMDLDGETPVYTKQCSCGSTITPSAGEVIAAVRVSNMAELNKALTIDSIAAIHLDAGTYAADSFVVNRNVSLIGVGKDATVLQATDDPTVFFQVTGNVSSFSMSGIHVKGDEAVSHNNHTGLVLGSESAYFGGTATITGCKFSGFTKNSLTVKGGSVTITNNDIICEAFTGAAGNGIQIDRGATAVITGNSIDAYVSQAENWSATGVLVLRDGKITSITNNAIRNCQLGVCVGMTYDTAEDVTTMSGFENNSFTNCGTNIIYQVGSASDAASVAASALPGSRVVLYETKTVENLMVPADVILSIYQGKTLTVTSALTVNGTLNVSSGSTLSLPAGTSTANIVGSDATSKLVVGETQQYWNPLTAQWGEALQGKVAAVQTGENTYAYYDTLSEAVSAALDNQTVLLLDNVTTDAQIKITSGITLDGRGYTLTAGTWEDGNPTSKGDAPLVSISTGGKPVLLKDITLSKAKSIGSDYGHGLNVYKSSAVTLSNVTIEDSAANGMVVNGSSVTATNLTISGSGWGQSIDVSMGSNVTTPSSLTLDSAEGLGDQYLVTEDGTSEASVTVGGTKWYAEGIFVPNEDPTKAYFKHIYSAQVSQSEDGQIRVFPVGTDEENGQYLRAVLAVAGEGQTIVLQEGNYNVTATAGTAMGGIAITTPNLTLKGEGTARIYARTNGGGTSNGIYQQNTLTIAADGVTLDGLTFLPIEMVNDGNNIAPKALEVTNAATSFTLRGCIFEAMEMSNELTVGNGATQSEEFGTYYGGQVSINTSSASNKDTILIENNAFNYAILDFRTAATIQGNTFNSGSGVYHAAAIRFRAQHDGSGNNQDYTDVVLSGNTFNGFEPDPVLNEEPYVVIVSKTVLTLDLSSTGLFGQAEDLGQVNGQWAIVDSGAWYSAYPIPGSTEGGEDGETQQPEEGTSPFVPTGFYLEPNARYGITLRITPPTDLDGIQDPLMYSYTCNGQEYITRGIGKTTISTMLMTSYGALSAGSNTIVIDITATPAEGNPAQDGFNTSFTLNMQVTDLEAAVLPEDVSATVQQDTSGISVSVSGLEANQIYEVQAVYDEGSSYCAIACTDEEGNLTRSFSGAAGEVTAVQLVKLQFSDITDNSACVTRQTYAPVSIAQ